MMKEKSKMIYLDEFPFISPQSVDCLAPKLLARQWLAQNSLILDTETTGLGLDDEVVEIAIIDCAGNVLLDTLVKPLNRIPDEAIAIHGITNEMVENSPTWSDVYPKVINLLKGRGFIAYNASFDARLICQSVRMDTIPRDEIDIIYNNHQCAMLVYAEFYGEWDDRRNKYKWQRLANAAKQQLIAVDGVAHRALSDCITTLGVIKAMAAGGVRKVHYSLEISCTTMNEIKKEIKFNMDAAIRLDNSVFRVGDLLTLYSQFLPTDPVEKIKVAVVDVSRLVRKGRNTKYVDVKFVLLDDLEEYFDFSPFDEDVPF
ncbi:3'-5' exonuclease [Yersinia proxima]|uniref:3'-5' exonuclease n=1 Tax=Yersinia proxima TaxID=2890316 RepID=UPI001D120924|nr:3'-5' exonuclease [Yersinia proxima]